jgi:hypothetical protein
MIAEVVDPQGDTDDKILLAARLCPTKAIVMEEEGTGKKLFPVEWCLTRSKLNKQLDYGNSDSRRL